MGGFIEEILGTFKGDNSIEIRNDDDRVDRLNYRWTVVLLMIFAGLVMAETYIMSDRINCWVPAHFKGAWEDYVNNYCWIRNTYYLPWDEHVPLDLASREKSPIIYYQWVPLFMLLQALFFFMPIQVWRTLNGRTGINANDIVETAEQVKRAEDEKIREKWKTFLSQQVHRYLTMSKKPTDEHSGAFGRGKCSCRNVLRVCCGCKTVGNYMCILYVFIKILFVVNAVGQLFILNWFLGRNYSLYGIKLIESWVSGEKLQESPYFPRVTFCDVEVRRLGNLHRYTVQCVLPINMFNEKIYAFLWFWFFFMAVLSLFSFFQWLLRVTLRVDSYRYITARLNQSTPSKYLQLQHQTDRDRVKIFIREYLRPDGVLIVRLIDYNTNKVTAEDVISAVYVNYLKRRKIVIEEDETDDDDDEKNNDDAGSIHKQGAGEGSSTSSEADNALQPTAPSHQGL